jgi:HD-like signal output (HDOD) protein/ActR/RegA family two-component response regulator
MSATADGADDPPGRCVLFVDDEPHLLAALRRALRPHRGRWNSLFATSGEEALAILESQRVDAVVSDMRMPGMDGAQLLAQVQLSFPSTARIVLSGDADLGSILAVVRSAQQFLAKPCDVATLTDAVDRSLTVSDTLNDPALRQLIGGVASLPTLPAVYHELVAEISSPDVDLGRITRIVGSDVATSTELLKLVNSAFFGLPREITSVESAVALLGLDNIQALVLAGSVFRTNSDLGQVLDVDALQAQAMRRAGIARAIAAAESWPGHERDIAVLACMLRDVGGLVLAEGLPQVARGLTAATDAEPQPVDPQRLAQMESAAYGCTVAQASAYLLGLWGFAPAVVHTVATYPLAQHSPGSGRFEHVLSFASRRVLGQGDVFGPETDEYLTAERRRCWDGAAEEVMAR